MTAPITLRNITLDPATGILTGLRGHVYLSDDACQLAERMMMMRSGVCLFEADVAATIGATVDTCSIGRLRRCIIDLAGALTTLSNGRIRLRYPANPTYSLTVRP